MDCGHCRSALVITADLVRHGQRDAPSRLGGRLPGWNHLRSARVFGMVHAGSAADSTRHCNWSNVDICLADSPHWWTHRDSLSYLRFISETTRPSDFIARYGGEEFCVILVGATELDAVKWAERARLSLRAFQFELAGSTRTITASFGVSERNENTH
jgi:Diguanylate cyclase, GGDEF domain